MDVTLKIWRSEGRDSDGRFQTYPMTGVDPSMSLLEVLDDLNDTLLDAPEGPVVFEHDCREGICGACSMTINGVPHGGKGRLTACQLHMHRFKDGETITLEPFRAGPFPPLRDLASDRAALDRIQIAGGYITASPGQAPDGNTIPIPKDAAERAFDLAACIGCWASLRRGDGRPAARWARAGPAHPRHGRGDGGGGIRRVFGPRRMCRRLPRGDRPRCDRRAQPRLAQAASPRDPVAMTAQDTVRTPGMKRILQKSRHARFPDPAVGTTDSAKESLGTQKNSRFYSRRSGPPI